jgi:thiol-disulfide isomerase/thioredoxin
MSTRSAPPLPAIARVVYYTAEWCGPATAYAPVVAAIASDPEYPIPVETRDVDKREQEANAHNVVGAPTLVALDAQGAVLGTLVGTRVPAAVQAWLADPAASHDP